MLRSTLLAAAALTLLPMAPAVAQPGGNIVGAAAANKNFSTLVAAIRAAKLTDTLASKGPFTVFAPTNDAFAKLDPGTVETLLEPENRDQLTTILTYHVIAGRVTAANLLQQIQAGNGQATLITVEGSPLVARVVDGKVVLTDENNRTATVTTTDLMQSNGIIHVIDTVVLPN